MIAKLRHGGPAGSQHVLTLVPESEADTKELLELTGLTGRSCIISHRGFQYMNAEVEFIIQPTPRGD